MTREEMIQRAKALTFLETWKTGEIAAQLQADGETIARLEARIEELEVALKPFGIGIWGRPFDALTVCNQDDLRRAFAALRPADKGDAP